MGDTQQPQPARTEATGAEAAAELAEIQRRQEQVIKATSSQAGAGGHMRPRSSPSAPPAAAGT